MKLTPPVIAVCVTAVVLIVILLFLNFGPCDTRENAVLKAYHFGFPTYGSSGPLKGGWPNPWWPRRRWGYHGYAGWGLPYGLGRGWGGYAPLAAGPYTRRGHPRRRGGWYYRNFIKPYLTGTCYSSSKDEDCQPGYSKTQKDANDDGVIDEDDEWLCCRDRDMF